MERGDCLGQIGRRDASSNDETEDATDGRESAELGEDLGAEADGKQRRQDTRADTENAQKVTHASSGLGSQTRDGADAENRADHVAGLHETSSPGGGGSNVTTSEESSGDGVQPGVLRRISWSCLVS